MSYFSYIPNELYRFDDKTALVKNICQRSKFITEYKQYSDLYTSYTVTDSDSLESLALQYYGSAKYHWVIALFNEIHDLDADFPMNTTQLENYCKAKYGDTGLNYTMYYVNRDGLIVNEIKEYTDSYVQPTPPGPPHLYTSISFFEHESILNDEKRNIVIMRPELLPSFISQFEQSFDV